MHGCDSPHSIEEQAPSHREVKRTSVTFHPFSSSSFSSVWTPTAATGSGRQRPSEEDSYHTGLQTKDRDADGNSSVSESCFRGCVRSDGGSNDGDASASAPVVHGAADGSSSRGLNDRVDAFTARDGAVDEQEHSQEAVHERSGHPVSAVWTLPSPTFSRQSLEGEFTSL